MGKSGGSESQESSSQENSAPDLEIFGDKVTLHPSGYIALPEKKVDIGDQALLTHAGRFRTAPLEFLREISRHISGSGWRSYQNPIGQPVFYAGFSENMKAAVVSTPILQKRISELASKRVLVEERDGLLNSNDVLFETNKAARKIAIEQSLQQLAERMTDEMICKMESNTFIRGAYYLCTELLTRAYHQGIHVSSEEVLRLRNVAKEAEKKRQSIIFLPCHRSHVDYVSLQLICYRLGIALPTVVAGDNLNFPAVGSFLQHAGAMYIRRSFGDDILYTTLVQSYIDTLLQGGFNFECFIEGGRSRTGKLLPPKFGILSFILDSILSGRVEDAIICPVSTQYDKVIETEGYVGELLGNPKKKENLADFLSSSSVLSLKLGRVDVRFHDSWSLRAFVQDQLSRSTNVPQQISMKAADNPAVRQRMLRTLGYKVLSDINAISVVMPTALIGTVLLTLRGRGVGKPEMVRRIEWLSDRVRAKGGRVAHFGGATTSAVIDRSLEVLGKDLVGLVEGLPTPTYYAVDRFHLSFYRNMTIHLFISEALVSASMYTKIKRGGLRADQRISFGELRDQVQFLSQLFRGEFIYPTDGLTQNLENTLIGLAVDKVIEIIRNNDGTIKEIGLSEEERAAGRENYDFYCFMIWPFIEASWLGAVSLMGLTPSLGRPNDAWVDVAKAQNSAQLLGKTLYHQGDLSYFEAVNKETLKNAYQRFDEEGIILVAKDGTSQSVPQMKLAPMWTPHRNAETGRIAPEGKLWDFIEKIAQSRREGKNRRDGATVSTRVLTLADTLGQSLLSAAVGDAAKEADALRRKERRGRAIATPMAHL